MLSFLLCSSDKSDLNSIQKASTDIAAYNDENWNVVQFRSLDEAENFWNKYLIDLACIEIVSDKQVSSVENFRKIHKETLIAVIADVSTMPVLYLKPTIMAASLLLRPFSFDEARRVVKELTNVSKTDGTDEGCFEFKIRDDVQRVPFRDILYFEARDKKIYIRTAYEEFSCYTTIEKLEETLPDLFGKCHRSFMINTERIKKIAFSENIIYMDDDSVVPLSRGCRNDAKKGWAKNA